MVNEKLLEEAFSVAFSTVDNTLYPVTFAKAVTRLYLEKISKDYVIVPRETTEQMWSAGNEIEMSHDSTDPDSGDFVEEIYKAMINAAEKSDE